ncbi:unnamed protein product (macronuclear) [Paramecium tetraurelia]|uniref:Uncharacterized protein n=1 Tax=Paramecium tetraurelia TaxID=5888 RepID=A0CHU7_PARTE|nr:uncharacterized protein GSPATT00038466001 [Paramecium tetraurelia]CAK70364.1 unnamed protein product [Paramecium tetraurelia]|eukprot:XP_001437761.1 hypothetical protein (macronuclear) [Paramecium tetraurelia strain d4-2]
MYYQNQRIPVPLQRIEFKHILSGLQKPLQKQDEINEKPLETRKNRKKPEVKFLQDLQRNEKCEQQALQLSDTMWDDRILQKLEKLKKQPKEFFKKVPKDPITLMNSSKINKFIEIKILAQSKEDVQKVSRESLRQMNQIQEVDVKELLNQYPHQFNFTTSADARKKKEVLDTKDKYMKIFFVRNCSTSMSKSKVNNKQLHSSGDSQKYMNLEQIKERKNNKNNLSFCTWSKLSELECPGYCTFIKQLAVKNKLQQSCCQQKNNSQNLVND